MGRNGDPHRQRGRRAEASVVRRAALAAMVAAISSLASLAPGAAAEERDPRGYPALPIAVDAAGWDRLARGEVVVELQDVAGSAVKRGVAVALIELPAERLFRVVTDNARFAEFMPHVAESTVETGADGAIVNFQRLDLPFVHDRYYRVRVVNSESAEDGWTVRRSAWTYVAGSGNIAESRGSWTLVELAASRTLLVYEVFTDPGGWIPAWLYNRATRQAVPDLIASVRERARSLD